MQYLKKIRLGTINRWDKEEEKISVFECIEKENIQYEKWDKRLQKNERASVCCGTTANNLCGCDQSHQKGRLRKKIYKGKWSKFSKFVENYGYIYITAQPKTSIRYMN